jgi:gamma-glutamyltranspeptidase / glutathione hydrolase
MITGEFQARPELQGTFGMVASTHWLASATGMAMLEQGGNAFDAAVAAAFVLNVAEPHLNGPGGDMPALAYVASENKVRVLAAQGPAPAGATIAHYHDLGLDMVPGAGLLAATVPGTVDGWLMLLADLGRLHLADVLAPAIHYAEHGCPVLKNVADTVWTMAQMFAAEWPTSASLWMPDGAPLVAGTLYRNPALAATWRRLLQEAETARGREAEIAAARRAWREGFVADAIDRFCRSQTLMDSSGRRHKGVLTGQDMAEWQARWEEPLTFDYGRYTLFKAGAWSQAPVFLQQLALLKGFDLEAMDPAGPDFVHTVVEAAKLAFADREGFYGDPDFVPVPMDELLSPAYNDQRRALITERASLAQRPGRAGGREGWQPGGAGTDRKRDASTGEPTVRHPSLGEPTVRHDGVTSGDTCHLDIVDRWGNMISATPSGGWLQSSPTIPELGFCLGSRAQMFWLDPDSPSSLAPKRRPRTTLTPSYAFRDGKPYMAFGTPGGDQQDQWALMFFLRHAHHGMSMQQSIEAPAWSSEHWHSSFWPRAAMPGRLLVESRFPAATIAELRRRGHEIEIGGPWSLGRLAAVSRDGAMLKAAANPRGAQGYAVGR